MGLYFYPKIVSVPADHWIHEHIEKIPERFERQKVLKDWVIEGPFHDEDKSEYYFMMSGRTTGTNEQFSIPEDDFLFNEKAVNNWVSRMISRCMEVELQVGTAQRIMGMSHEDVNQAEGEDTFVVEDYSRGSGEVTHRRHSRGEEAACPENSGGLILPGH